MLSGKVLTAIQVRGELVSAGGGENPAGKSSSIVYTPSIQHTIGFLVYCLNFRSSLDKRRHYSKGKDEDLYLN